MFSLYEFFSLVCLIFLLISLQGRNPGCVNQTLFAFCDRPAFRPVSMKGQSVLAWPNSHDKITFSELMNRKERREGTGHDMRGEAWDCLTITIKVVTCQLQDKSNLE